MESCSMPQHITASQQEGIDAVAQTASLFNNANQSGGEGGASQVARYVSHS